MTETAHPADRLSAAIKDVGNCACVGLDPVLDRLPEAIDRDDPARAIETFCAGVIEAVAGVVPAVKPQSACFERYGSAGVRVLEATIARAREAGLVVVLDVKRGDIGSTADHYAAAASGMGADWVTVNPYMGASAVEPFLDAGLGVYALVRTSNPDAGRVQEAELAGGGTVAEHVAGLVHELGAGRLGRSGLSAMGAVVGATLPEHTLDRLRGLLPNAPLLVPGVGAQGGDPAALGSMGRTGQPPETLGLLINASRSVLYPNSGGDEWVSGVGEAARAFVALIG